MVEVQLDQYKHQSDRSPTTLVNWNVIPNVINQLGNCTTSCRLAKHALSWSLRHSTSKSHGKTVCCACFRRWMIPPANCTPPASCCRGVRSCGEFVWSFWTRSLESTLKVCCRLGCLATRKLTHCFGELVDAGKLSFCFCNDNYVWALETLLLCWSGEDVRVRGSAWEREGRSCESTCNERAPPPFTTDSNR